MNVKTTKILYHWYEHIHVKCNVLLRMIKSAKGLFHPNTQKLSLPSPTFDWGPAVTFQKEKGSHLFSVQGDGDILVLSNLGEKGSV